MNFSDQFFHPDDDPIPETHPYVSLSRELDWDEIVLQLSEFYCDGNGRPAIPIKNMVLLLMFKHLDGYSDRELIEVIAGSMPMQKALNIPFKIAQKYIDPSSLSKFRERIGEKGLSYINQAVESLVKKKAPKKSRKVFVDTTVVPSNILFPTDIHLLESARKFLVKVIRKFSDSPVRTYCRKARRVFLQYIKLRRTKRIYTRKVQGKIIRFACRNLKQANKVMEVFKKRKKIPARVRRIIEKLGTIETLLSQQKEIHRQTPRSGNKSGIRIPNRIVSIHKPHVRPMPRGKIPVPTEFGGKILLEWRNGIVKLLHTCFDNIADSELLRPHLSRYSGLDLGGDRGFHSPENTRLAAELNIRNYCIEKKGKQSAKTESYLLKQMRKKRSGIEAKISLAKRKYGLRKNLYGRGAMGESQWIGLGIMAMNLKHVLVILPKKRAIRPVRA